MLKPLKPGIGDRLALYPHPIDQPKPKLHGAPNRLLLTIEQRISRSLARTSEGPIQFGRRNFPRSIQVGERRYFFMIARVAVFKAIEIVRVRTR